MKIGILGDLHLTNKSPQRRMDDYWKTLRRKLSQALKIFDDKKCEIVIQVGDFFDSPTAANKVKSEVIQLLHNFRRWGPERIFCIFGQHDISGHSKATLSNSPLAVLESARVVKILDDNPVIAGLEGTEVFLYGASFGESIPEPHEDFYNILVTHRMIGDKPLWPGQELPGPRQFLRKYPNFNLVICGDYHYRFTDNYNGQTIINPGALVRKTISKFDLEHKPAVVIFDKDTGESEVLELEIDPPEKVFDLTSGTKKQDNQALITLVEKLKTGGKQLSGWKRILLQVLEERKSSQKVKQIIDECLEEIK